MSSDIDLNGNPSLISICGPLRSGGAWSCNYVVFDQASRAWSRNYVVYDQNIYAS